MKLVHDFLRETAVREPEKPALICGDKVHTFGGLEHDSDRIARALQQAGITRGDHVALFLENSAELVVSLRQDARLCRVAEDVEADEPQVICSLGLRKPD